MANNKPSQNNNVKVMIKIRPLIEREIEKQDKICWDKISDNEILERDTVTPAKPCIYDHVFGDTATTQAIYDMAISHIIDSCVQGFNGSVMAYGQTASGKTYTMMGNENNPGIIRLVAENIFDIIEQHDDRDIYMVRCSFLEIYNEKINDLLSPDKTNLEVFETPDGTVMIKEATEKVVRKAVNMVELIEQGNATKRTGVTAANDCSSRSHTIFRIMIESQEVHDDGTSIKMGVLDLVDLAGSESVNKTKASGDRFKEGISINKSLSELGRVIQELSEKKEGDNKFISYRNSILTRVIQHSLGGNAKSVVICTVSPSTAEREETRNTLRFASRAKNVKNSPKLNEILSDQAMIKRLNQKINGLHKQIAELKGNQGAQGGQTVETIRKNIIERIQLCEMQFIRSKKSARMKNHRRQTWHAANLADSRQDSSENEQDSVRALMPPPPPIFTMQRGTNSIHSHETYQMPEFDTNEQFEPGETVSFDQTPSPKKLNANIHTPTIFARRLSSIMEDSPAIGSTMSTCDRCKELEKEIQELSEFTKLEQIYHVHDEADIPSCTDLIDLLKSELDEANKKIDMNNAEINTLKQSIIESSDLLNAADRAKIEALKEKEIAESQCGGIEYELEALKIKFEKRESELLGLLEERKIEYESSQAMGDSISEKLKSTEKELFDLQLSVESDRVNWEKSLKEKSDELEELRQSFELKAAKNREYEEIITKKENQIRELTTKLNDLDTELKTSNDTITGLKSDFTHFIANGNNKQGNLSEFLSKISQLLGIDTNISEKSFNSICADDLAGDFTLNSTSGTTVTGEENHNNESIPMDISSKMTQNETISMQSPTKINEIQVLQKELEEASVQIKELKQKNKILQKEYDETSMQLMEAIQDYDLLKSENDKISAINLTPKQEASDLKAKNSDLQTQLEQATKQIEHFKQELNELRSTLEELVPIVAEKDKLDHLYQEIVQQSTEMTNEITEKTREIETLKKIIEDQKKTITESYQETTTNEEREQNITELQTKIDTLERCLAEQKIENQDLVKKIEAEILQNTNLNEILLTEQNVVKELTAKLDEIQHRLEQKENELNLLNTRLANAESLISMKSNEFSLVQEEKEENLNKMAEIIAEKELLEQEVERLKAQILSNDTKANDLIDHLRAKCQDLQENSSDVNSMAESLRILEEKIKTITTEKESLLIEKAKLSSEMSDLAQNFAKTVEEQKKREEQLKDRCELVESLKQEVSDYVERLNQETSENSALIFKLETAEKDVDMLKSEILGLNNQITVLSKEKTVLEEKAAELMQIANQEASENSNLRSKLETAEKDVDMLKSEILGLKNQITCLSEEKTVLREKEAEFEVLKSKHASLLLDLDQIKSCYSQATDKMDNVLLENSKYKTENSDLIMKLATVEEELAREGQKYEQKLNELSDIQSKLETSTKEIAALQQKITIKDQKLNEVQMKLNQLEAEHEQHTKDMFELDDLRKRTVQDRRSRRQSAHDELRPLVRSIKGRGVQTDPTDENCQCSILNEKLEKMKIELLKAKVTADHYRLGNNQKVGDIKEEKEKVEKKLEECLLEINRLNQEGVRLRKEREHFRERLRKMEGDLKKSQEKASCQHISRETQTELPIINMNSDAVSLDQKLYIKKLEDDLTIQIKKYQDCKKIAQDRRERIREKEAEIAALQNRSPDGGKENATNNIQISALKNENLQLKKENCELVQHYNHYKSLYLTKLPQNNNRQDNSSQTDSIASDDHTKVKEERDVFEKKYRKAVTLFNAASKGLEDYKRNYVICASENRALATALSRFDKDYTPKPIEEVDEMYQEGFEEWKRQNPDFVNRFNLKN